MSDRAALDLQIARVEELVTVLEQTADPAVRDAARHLVQALMCMHEQGLARILEILRAVGGPGRDLIDRLGDEELLRSLLLLHNLHPTTLETRIEQALERVRPLVRAQAADVHLIDLDDDGRATVWVDAAAPLNESAASVVCRAVENAIHEAAPDISELRVDGLANPTVAAFIPLTSVGRDASRAPTPPETRPTSDPG